MLYGKGFHRFIIHIDTNFFTLPSSFINWNNMDRWYQFFRAMMLLYAASLTTLQHALQIRQENSNRVLWELLYPCIKGVIQ